MRVSISKCGVNATMLNLSMITIVVFLVSGPASAQVIREDKDAICRYAASKSYDEWLQVLTGLEEGLTAAVSSLKDEDIGSIGPLVEDEWRRQVQDEAGRSVSPDLTPSSEQKRKAKRRTCGFAVDELLFARVNEQIPLEFSPEEKHLYLVFDESGERIPGWHVSRFFFITYLLSLFSKDCGDFTFEALALRSDELRFEVADATNRSKARDRFCSKFYP